MTAMANQALVDPTVPIAPTAACARDWAESARRHRMLTGEWRDDLKAIMRRQFSAIRMLAIGTLDITHNLVRATAPQLAVLYLQPPPVSHDDQQGADLLMQHASDAGLWELALWRQQLDIMMRESFLSVDVVDEGTPDARLLYKIVPRHLFHVEADPDNPDVPVKLWWWRKVQLRNGGTAWGRWHWDISNPDAPVFDILANAEDKSIANFTNVEAGWRERWRWADGKPLIPGTLYHAVRTGNLTDSHYGVEFFEGSLCSAAGWNLWRNIVKDASWPQRFSINAKPLGVQVDPATSLAVVHTDPTSILNFMPHDSGIGQTSVGQLEPGGDPVTFGNALRARDADVSAHFDMNPQDIKREHVDSRSGHAIELTRSGQRAAQRRYEPSARRGDLETISKSAAIWNRATSSTLPESGYAITYTGLPLSVEEKRELLEEFKLKIDLGIASRPALLAELDGITEAEAAERIAVIDAAKQTTTPPQESQPDATRAREA